MTDIEPAPKKKRKKSTSPTARTLAECRKRGWIAQVVERRIPKSFVTVDFIGCIDVIAIVAPRVRDAKCATCVLKRPYSGEPFTCPNCGTPNDIIPGHILGIQTTSNNGGNHSARVHKILAEPRAQQWIEAGGKLQVWSWSQTAKRKPWTLRTEDITLADFEAKDAAA